MKLRERKNVQRLWQAGEQIAQWQREHGHEDQVEQALNILNEYCRSNLPCNTAPDTIFYAKDTDYPGRVIIDEDDMKKILARWDDASGRD